VAGRGLTAGHHQEGDAENSEQEGAQGGSHDTP